MLLVDNINPFYFFISFAVGLFIVYIFRPPPQVVVKFPTPYNAGQVLYKDKNDTCYKYKAQKVSCPVQKDLVKPQPLFEDFGSQKLSR